MDRTRTRTSSTIPFGWEVMKNDEHMLTPNDLEQEVLEQLHTIRKAQSLRSMAKLIKAKTGRSVTPRGVNKILDRGYT